jgi:hypothetical protein
MSELRDILVNLVAAFIGFIICWVWHKAYRAIRTQRTRRALQPFEPPEGKTVIGCFASSDLQSFEQSGLIGVGDALALSEILAQCRLAGLTPGCPQIDKSLQGDDLRSNLILLGGPDVNSVTNDVWRSLKTTLRFALADLHVVSVHDEETNQWHSPVFDASQRILKDIGLVVDAPNPFDSDRRVIVIAGAFGYATWAGARFLASKEFLSIQRHKTMITEFLIETSVVRQTPQQIRCVLKRETRL